MPIILIIATLLTIIITLLIVLGRPQPEPTYPHDEAPAKHPPAALHAHLLFEPYRLDDGFTFDSEPIKNTKLFEDLLKRLKQRRVECEHTHGACIARLILDGVPFVLELEELPGSARSWHLALQSTIEAPATKAELEYIITQLIDSLKFLEVSTPKVLTQAQWEATQAA